MPTRARRASRALMTAASLLMLAAPTLAAQSVTVRGGGDSTWIVPRARLAEAPASLATRDGQVAIVLLDTTLVLQFTDAGLRRFHASLRDSTPQSFGTRMVAQMIGAALGTMFDHGIASPLASLRGARVENGLLILDGRDGRRVFEHVEVDGRDVMSDFTPADAARFAARVNRAIGR